MVVLKERTAAHEATTPPRIDINIYLPPQRLTNAEIAQWKTPDGQQLFTEEALSKKLGIENRPIADKHETVTSMGIASATPIIDKYGTDFDAVFFTSSYPTGINNAAFLAQHFGLNPNLAVDVFAACSGYALVFTYLASRGKQFEGKKILVVSSEDYTPALADPRTEEGRIQDPSSSKTIFGAGSSTSAFIWGETVRSLEYKAVKLSGEDSESIRMPIDYTKVRGTAIAVKIPSSDSGKLWMNGKGVLATSGSIANLAKDVIWKSGINHEEIDLIVPHQPSLTMLKAIERHLPDDLRNKLFYDLREGNLSSVSIPKALRRAVLEGKVHPDSIILLLGFGAGMYGSANLLKLLKVA